MPTAPTPGRGTRRRQILGSAAGLACAAAAGGALRHFGHTGPDNPFGDFAVPTGGYRFEPRRTPDRTVVRAADGRVLATFTDGARTAVLTGPTRTWREPRPGPGRAVDREHWAAARRHQHRQPGDLVFFSIDIGRPHGIDPRGMYLGPDDDGQPRFYSQPLAGRRTHHGRPGRPRDARRRRLLRHGVAHGPPPVNPPNLIATGPTPLRDLHGHHVRRPELRGPPSPHDR